LFWIYSALIAYLINAIAFIIDKYLLVTHITRPLAYAFGVAVLSVFALVLLPFGVTLQSPSYLLIAFLSGCLFFVALIFLYKNIIATDISIASTMSGSATAAFSYFFALIILGESLDLKDMFIILILLAGMLFLGKIDKSAWPIALLAGMLFSLSFIFLKISFNNSDFINGIFWTRMGFVASALLSLIFNPFRKDIVNSIHGTRVKIGVIFVINKILTAAGFVLLYYSIKLGRVSIINSLLGFQFLFIFIFALFLRKKIPQLEKYIDKKHLIQKILGIIFIIIGFFAVIIL
jgi:drug/metabolite transporter (DMT)-like permease